MIYDRRKSGLWTPRHGAPAIIPASSREAWAFRARQSAARMSSDIIVTNGLVINTDARNSASYSGSGDWKNLVAVPADGSTQASNDFTGTGATPPSFVGSVGSPSAYFQTNGTGYFYRGAANSTFINSLHKDNAAFTMLAVYYFASVASFQCFVSTNGSSATVGVIWSAVNTANINGFSVYMGTLGVPALQKEFDTAEVSGVWQIRQISIDEAGNGFETVNGAYNKASGSDTWSAAYTLPSSAAAESFFRFGATSTGAQLWSNGSRYAYFAMWNRALTKDETDQNFAALRSGWGL